MKAPSKKSSIVAAIMWVIGIILAFKIPPSSNFIWLPDALLLFGFYPLFISSKSPWLWLIFGFIDIFISGILLIAASAPPEELTRLHVLEMNNHMQSYHPYYTWAIIGFISTFIALIQLALQIIKWFANKLLKNK